MTKRWPEFALGDLCEVIAGQSPEGKYYNSERQGLPFYQGKKEFGDRRLGPPTKWTRVITKVSEPDDIVMSVRAPVGPVNLVSERICIGRGLAAIRHGKQLHRDFLFYQLEAMSNLIAGSEGAVFPSINKEQIRALRIVVPPLDEQERIVRILDEALKGIAKAHANIETNIANADMVFIRALEHTFAQVGSFEDRTEDVTPSPDFGRIDSTRHGAKGRAATTRHIPGPLSLAVGAPRTEARPGWRWVELTSIADLESGHTPSRRHPEYWGGDIPWIGIQDAREFSGSRIDDTSQHVTSLGIENSSARLLPTDTVCMSRTASLGYVVITNRPMATSQDFVNWVCTEHLDPDFLMYLLLAEGRDGLTRYSSGAVHQTIYYPEVKAFHVCVPSIEHQRSLVERLRELKASTSELRATFEQKANEALFVQGSILQAAFAGRL